jgi:hypothetical protein
VAKDYLTTSSDTITINTSAFTNLSTATSGLGNVTIGGQGYYTLNSGLSPSVSTTITTNSIGPISIDQLSTYSSFHVPEEWDGRFPDWGRIQSMCEQYPGLQIAYEKFKTTYLLVKNHYDTPEDQRPLP